MGRGLTASLLGLAAGCARLPNPFGGGGEAAFLLPLTGSAASLGQNMARAASLVPGARQDQPPVFDTSDTVEGARIAASRALDGGAKMLLGPLKAEQAPAVLAVAEKVPVVTFSNDDRLAGQGAFVMGITPAQSVATTFSYARAQGKRRIAVVAVPGPLGDATAEAARKLAAAGGLTLTAVLRRASEEFGIVEALRTASSGILPDAVFLPDAGADLRAFSGQLAGSGVQMMGGVQWGMVDPATSPALSGAWFAAPPPARFLPFMDEFAARFNDQAGIVTALGHDAAQMVSLLAGERSLDRRGLIREEGFQGVLGKFRFLEDGRCQRDLTVLTIEGGQIVPIGEVADT